MEKKNSKAGFVAKEDASENSTLSFTVGEYGQCSHTSCVIAPIPLLHLISLVNMNQTCGSAMNEQKCEDLSASTGTM